MALESYARNVYGPKQFGDISLVHIKLGAGVNQAALVAAESSPGVVVTAAGGGGGVITFTFPGAVFAHVVGSELVNAGATTLPASRTLSYAAGVYTYSLTLSADLAGDDQLHMTFITAGP